MAGASGRITSNFTVTDEGDVADEQLGLIFLSQLRERSIAMSKSKLVLALALISLATATTAYSNGPRSSRANAEATATETASSPPRASSRHARYRPVRIVDSSFHSSELVTTAPADIVRQTRSAVLRFLSENTVKSAGGEPAGTLPGDTAVPFWPHETGALSGTSETYVDVRADGTYYDPSIGRRVAEGSESVSVPPDDRAGG